MENMQELLVRYWYLILIFGFLINLTIGLIKVYQKHQEIQKRSNNYTFYQVLSGIAFVLWASKMVVPNRSPCTIPSASRPSMNDLESKVPFLVYYIQSITRIALVIPDDYVARLYARAVFIGVDSFLKIAPALKNQLKRADHITSFQEKEIKKLINKLTDEYRNYYSTIRHKLAAHQQEVDLGLLLECWNEIDDITLNLFTDDVTQVWGLMKDHMPSIGFPAPPELSDEKMLKPFSSIQYSGAGVRIGLDRVALTRQNTVSMFAAHSSQEKAMRVITAFEGFRVLLDSRLELATSKWCLPEKASIDLMVIDTVSVIDNIFGRDGDGEMSLHEMWKESDIAGADTLKAFSRDSVFEASLLQLRNKVSAHLDTAEQLSVLFQMLESFSLNELFEYMKSLWNTFESACKQDIRTKPFLIHGTELKGVIAVEDTGAIKPFRTDK